MYDRVILGFWEKLSLRLLSWLGPRFSLEMATSLPCCWFDIILVNDGKLVK